MAVSKSFPTDFLWGGATAANQLEGAGDVGAKDFPFSMCIYSTAARPKNVGRINGSA